MYMNILCIYIYLTQYSSLHKRIKISNMTPLNPSFGRFGSFWIPCFRVVAVAMNMSTQRKGGSTSEKTT